MLAGKLVFCFVFIGSLKQERRAGFVAPFVKFVVLYCTVLVGRSAACFLWAQPCFSFNKMSAFIRRARESLGPFLMKIARVGFLSPGFALITYDRYFELLSALTFSRYWFALFVFYPSYTQFCLSSALTWDRTPPLAVPLDRRVVFPRG